MCGPSVYLVPTHFQAEIRDILNVYGETARGQAGSLLADVGCKAKLTDEEFTAFDSSFDQTPSGQ